jgi:hypothetical protein
MKPDGFLEQVEAALVEAENRRNDSVEQFSRPWPVIEIRPVVLPAGVVQKCEKAHHRQIGSTAFGDVEAKCIDPLPVAWTVDGM